MLHRVLMIALTLALATPVSLGQFHAVEPIHEAARTGDLAGLRALIDAGMPVDRRARGSGPGTWDDTTPLTWAALLGNAECVAFLLDAGADVNGAECVPA